MVTGLTAQTPKKVAFFAGLSDNVGPTAEPVDVIFDRVITNVGEAYDVSTGRFTAPVNGTYTFNCVISAQGRQKASARALCVCDVIVTCVVKIMINY